MKKLLIRLANGYFTLASLLMIFMILSITLSSFAVFFPKFVMEMWIYSETNFPMGMPFWFSVCPASILIGGIIFVTILCFYLLRPIPVYIKQIKTGVKEIEDE